MDFKCPVCTAYLLRQPDAYSDSTDFSCPNCGRFRLTGSALAVVEGKTERNLEARAILSHSIRRMQKQDRRPELHSEMVKSILKNNKLPTPAEQADNLIIWLGENLDGPGEPMELEPQNIKAVVGAKTSAGASFIIKSLYEKNMLEDVEIKAIGSLTSLLIATLTFAGWQYYEELKKGLSDSRKAFMAMKFGDQELDSIVDDHFKPAVDQTGFYLFRLTEKPRAGLIDNRMRVEIRTSRFLIADLSHGNQGAYWEAGYAEGLGKPVIYTCKKEIFEDPKTKPHFDANHHLTIIWNKDNPDDAAKELKATIRATLPDEAKLEDD